MPITSPSRRASSAGPARGRVRALAIAGVMINEQDRRRGLHAWHRDSLVELFGDLVWQPSIPSRSALAEAIEAGEPLRVQTGSAVRDLVSIFDELADRVKKLNAA